MVVEVLEELGRCNYNLLWLSAAHLGSPKIAHTFLKLSGRGAYLPQLSTIYIRYIKDA